MPGRRRISASERCSGNSAAAPHGKSTEPAGAIAPAGLLISTSFRFGPRSVTQCRSGPPEGGTGIDVDGANGAGGFAPRPGKLVGGGANATPDGGFPFPSGDKVRPSSIRELGDVRVVDTSCGAPTPVGRPGSPGAVIWEFTSTEVVGAVTRLLVVAFTLGCGLLRSPPDIGVNVPHAFGMSVVAPTVWTPIRVGCVEKPLTAVVPAVDPTLAPVPGCVVLPPVVAWTLVVPVADGVAGVVRLTVGVGLYVVRFAVPLLVSQPPPANARPNPNVPIHPSTGFLPIGSPLPHPVEMHPSLSQTRGRVCRCARLRAVGISRQRSLGDVTSTTYPVKSNRLSHLRPDGGCGPVPQGRKRRFFILPTRQIWHRLRFRGLIRETASGANVSARPRRHLRRDERSRTGHRRPGLRLHRCLLARQRIRRRRREELWRMIEIARRRQGLAGDRQDRLTSGQRDHR